MKFVLIQLLLYLVVSLTISQCQLFHHPCIPVMGVSVFMDTMNFLPRLLKSLDFCIVEFVLVLPKQNPQNYEQSLYLEEVTRLLNNKFIIHHNIIIMNNFLLGVAEGWNKILKSQANSPWYLICGYDVEFLPGQLEGISFRFWNHSGSLLQKNFTDPLANFVHTRWQNLPGGKGYGLFALSQEVITNCGYFDENIFPAFWEDRDWKMRLSLWKGSKIKTYRNIRPWHGLYNLSTSQSPTASTATVQIKYISGTTYLPTAWRNVMEKASAWNREYVVRKWGCSLQLSMERHDLLNCTHTTPFGNKNYNITTWILQHHRINQLRKLYDSFIQLPS